MKTLQELTKEERSLLLFLECRSVDHGGRVDSRHMNDADFDMAQRWALEGFIGFGRICSNDCTERGNHWCLLSDQAHALAAGERRARAQRMWAARSWKTTDEKRTEAA